MAITDIVFDFDGTCTQIPAIYDKYLEKYRQIFNETVSPLTADDWQKAQQQVRTNSPKAGWMLGGCPSAPAAADPYILAYESANHILRERKIKNSLSDIHSKAAEANQAPWRMEAREIFEMLLKKNINIHFVSNSSSLKITQRLQDLLGVAELPHGISVKSDAAKFLICELAWDKKKDSIPIEIQEKFIKLPVSFTYTSLSDLERPVYLRRGVYFEAIYDVFKADWNKLATSVFCGDIWELDLAMPYALGANIHLIERTAPFNTYDYERKVIAGLGNRAKISNELSGLLGWF